MNTKNFRYDINGLRAYAVTLVVLFHFGIPGFAAGFIGVDIFFVISGFLMTSILVKGLESASFSFLKFYLSRAIRIIPALFSVCLVLMLLGWFILLPIDYAKLAKHVSASLHFFSNHVYLKESGYFDTDAFAKALLHTWSLSVEWQFYLLLPVLLTVIYKLKSSRKLLVYLYILGIILSFSAAIIMGYKQPSAGFYVLPTRTWELLLGGLLFFIPPLKSSIKAFLEYLGFLLVLSSLIVLDSSMPWPSYNALLPVLGTCLILAAQNNASRFTRPQVMQWLGEKSYSIYLWHWPILFFIHYFYKQDQGLYIGLGLVLSILFGWISYQWIEAPTRRYLTQQSNKKNIIIWIVAVGSLTLFCSMIQRSQGVSARFSKDIMSIMNVSEDKNPRLDECLLPIHGSDIKTCRYGQGPLSLIVVGDSHADAMMNGILHALPPHSAMITYTMSGCPTVEALKMSSDPKYQCGERITKIIQDLQSYPSHIPVLVVNRANAIFQGQPENDPSGAPTRYVQHPHDAFDALYFQEMETAYLSTLNKLSQSHPVFVTRPTPEAPINVVNLASRVKQYALDDSQLKIRRADYMKRSKLTWHAQDKAAEQFGIHLIDLSSFFCDQQFCHFTDQGMPLFRDDDHMSWNASKQLAPLFQQALFPSLSK